MPGMGGGGTSSSLPTLFKAWGVEMSPGKVEATDSDNAVTNLSLHLYSAVETSVPGVQLVFRHSLHKMRQTDPY